MKTKPFVGGFEEKWVIKNCTIVHTETSSDQQQQTSKA